MKKKRGTMKRRLSLSERRPYVCIRCFNDKRLIEWITEKAERGNCSWCLARGTFIVHLTELGEAFREVANIYTPSDDWHGDSISFFLQQDWDVFSERLLAKYDYDVQELVVEILTGDLDPKETWDYPDYNGSFHSTDSSLEGEWEDRVERLLGGVTGEFDIISAAQADEIDRLEFALSETGISYPTNSVLYRARKHLPKHGHDRFSASDLGAPSSDNTRAQRANQAGNPVLYMASDTQTALAEVRAWKGAVVAVGEMRIVKDVSVLDLREVPRIESPFFDTDLAWRLETNALFRRFGEELSRPILPDEPEAQYARTQHLCDLVRKAGYGGIAYPSAMGPGYNVVLFDPAAAVAEDIEYFTVLGVEFASEKVKAEKIYFDD